MSLVWLKYIISFVSKSMVRILYFSSTSRVLKMNSMISAFLLSFSHVHKRVLKIQNSQNGSFCISLHLNWSKFVTCDMTCVPAPPYRVHVIKMGPNCTKRTMNQSWLWLEIGQYRIVLANIDPLWPVLVRLGQSNSVTYILLDLPEKACFRTLSISVMI